MRTGHLFKINYNYNSVAWVSERTIPSDRRLSAKLEPTFADKGGHVASVMDPYGRILDFLDRTYLRILNWGATW
jgi:hypothetical protein